MKSIIKVIILSMAFALCSSLYVSAEDIHLNNGRTLNGKIVRQTNELVTILLNNGNTVEIPTSDITEIAKSQNKLAKYNTIPTGYRGFIDIAHSFVNFGWYNRPRFEVHTSHGYQINPHLFVGAGAGIMYMINSYYKAFPTFFGHIRSEILKKWATPFADLKVGYSKSGKDVDGLYFAPSIGYRIAFSKHIGIYASVGYILQQGVHHHIYIDDKYTFDCSNLFVRLGFDF